MKNNLFSFEKKVLTKKINYDNIQLDKIFIIIICCNSCNNFKKIV